MRLFDIIVTVVLIIFAGVILFIMTYGFKQYQEQTNTIKQIDGHIAKVEGQFVTKKELEQSLMDLNKNLVELIRQNKEQVKQITEVVASLKATVKHLQESDATYSNQDRPELDYYFKKVYTKSADGKEFPIAWCMFKPKKKKWTIGTYDLDFYVDVFQTENPDGKVNQYVQVFVGNDMDKGSKGKKYPIKVKQVKFHLLKPREKRFFWFNPKLDIGLSYTKDINGSVGLTLSSYGRTKNDSDWQFLRLGVNTGGQYEISPVGFNLGSVLPIVSDLWIYPVFSTGLREGRFGLCVATNF